MRILFVRQGFSSFGGGELILDRLLRALAEEGAEVSILARSWPDRPPGIGFIRCDPPRVTRALRDRLFAAAACRLVATQADALVQAHERIACCDIYRAGEGVHAAYLERRERDLSAVARTALRMSPFHRSVLGLERALFASRRLKAVVAISRMVAEDIGRHYNYPSECIHHIPNGVDLGRFNPAVRSTYRAAVRSQIGVADETPVVLLVGSGFARKGLAAAIRALARLKKHAELWVVGYDTRAKRFREMAERIGIGDRVRFFGPQRDPLPWYGASDISVLPSIYEPFGSAALEAMACGLPTVVSTSCGARELVEQFNPALVRNAFDESDLAGGLDLAFDLACRPESPIAVRAAAEMYSFDKMVERLMALYRRLAPMAGALR